MEVGSIVFSPLRGRLDEYILQNKQHCENIHCRGDTLEIAAQGIQHHVADHTAGRALNDLSNNRRIVIIRPF